MTDTTRTAARRRGRPPASDSAVTRERILRAARRLFADIGYEATTFQAIATEIGRTRPSINIYFANKSAFYYEVLARAGEAVTAANGAAEAAPTLGDQIVEFIRVTFGAQGAGDRDSALTGVLWGVAVQVSRRPHPGRVRADRMLGQLDALLDHGMRRAA